MSDYESMRDDFDAIVQLTATPLLISDLKGYGWDAHDNGPLSSHVRRSVPGSTDYLVALSHQVTSASTDTALFSPEDAETLGRRLIASAQAVRARRDAAERS